MDVDGTLQSSERQLYKMLRRQQRQLKHWRARVQLTIATGRTLAGVRPLLLESLVSPNVPIILYNGGAVIQNTTFEILHCSTIPLLVLNRILSVCRFFG